MKSDEAKRKDEALIYTFYINDLNFNVNVFNALN